MISVQHNMLAENADRQLNVNTKKNAKIAEKLSSGYRINRAADDAAGLAISEKMRRQVRGLGQAADNIKDGIGYVQTAEGALNEAQDILQRINQLAVQAANGTNTVSDRAYINSEVQALKEELSRIFSTTTFNEQRIWEPDEVMPGNEGRTAVRISGHGSDIDDVTTASCGVIPYAGLTIHSEEAGIKVGWTGYNGTAYSTELITWEEMKNKNYSFDISDYFDANNTELYPNGNKLFSYTINMEVNEGATIQQIKDSLDRFHIGTSYTIALSGNNGNSDTVILSKGVYVEPGILDDELAYKLHNNAIYNYDQKNDDFIKPNKIANNGSSNLTSYPSPGTVEEAKKSDDIWTFSFEMDGVGIVTASSRSVSYYSGDNDTTWYYEKNGHRYLNVRYIDGGTFKSVMDTLTGAKTDETPGLLTASKIGGYISLNFSLKDAAGIHVGMFSIGVDVTADDTEAKILDKIKSALNQDTVVDLYTAVDSENIYFWSVSSSYGQVGTSAYDRTASENIQNFWVQAGAEAGQHIDIEYESLSLWALGMQDTDTLTAESASRAINEVKGALQVVSDQRSLFGAYQNRLEHAYNINKNVEENTQASESLIRDTDIADAMMEFSINNILLQAGTSMLTQANQSSQLIMQLLS